MREIDRRVSYIRAHEDEVGLPAETVDENRSDHDDEEVLRWNVR